MRPPSATGLDARAPVRRLPMPWLESPRGVGLLVATGVLMGISPRLIPVLAADFPLNDGGLFLAMADDLRRSEFALPITTGYNLDSIPFAYPPLAIYMLAFLAGLGIDPIEVLRWLPALISVLTLPLVYLVARDLLGSWRLAGMAVGVFAILPRSYEWLITGGGLTRSLGMFLALLAIWQGVRLIRWPSRTHVALTGLAGGLTLLTHPEAAMFVFLSLGLFLLSFGRSVRLFTLMAGAGVIGIAVALPWLVTTAARHGTDILVGAADTRTAQLAQTLRELLFGHFTGAADLNVFLGIGLLGLLVQVARRRYLLPAWFAVVSVGIVAAGFTYAMVPWAMLTAIVLSEVVLPAVARLVPVRQYGRAVMAAGLVGAGLLSSLATGYDTNAPLHSLSRDQRIAMEWVSSHLPEDARVAVITGVPWQIDATSEWFPVLARRHSLATPQGYEWTQAFGERVRRHGALQQVCARRTLGCLDSWLGEFSLAVDYVYVPKGKLAGLGSQGDCCPAMRTAIRDAHVVYDGAGATIVRMERAARASRQGEGTAPSTP